MEDYMNVQKHERTVLSEDNTQGSEELHIMTSEYDAWITEDKLLSATDEELGWFKDELGLTREDLHLAFARMKEIKQQLRSDDDILDLTYDTGGGWYIAWSRKDPGGEWHVHIHRKDPAMARPDPGMATLD
jgi:hypothetical protein